jgi:hypothetical protein
MKAENGNFRFHPSAFILLFGRLASEIFLSSLQDIVFQQPAGARSA